MFNALLLEKNEGDVTASLRELDDAQLPDGDVTVSVLYSSLNYKDGLAVTGKGKIVRGDYPFVPGIDLVGTVEASEASGVQEGDTVVVTGWGLGEDYWGGYAQKQRIRADWTVPLPAEMSPLEAMEIGTAGFTAMLSVMGLEKHGVTPERGEVVVTGASGGVGSFAVAILAQRGYDVVASTGSEDAHDYLRALGATRLIGRDELGEGPKRPLDSMTWAGAVDTVGGATLSAIVTTLQRHGCVASCGLAGGAQLDLTVFPFILRGVDLHGVDSVQAPHAERREAWERLAADLSKDALERILEGVVGLGDVPEKSEAILRGDVRGRIVVDVNA